MRDDLEILAQSPLFQGVAPGDADAMLGCLSASKKQYGKNQTILQAGQRIGSLGMVLEGSVYITREDFWGNRNILAVVKPGQLFAEVYACRPDKVLTISAVTAGEGATVLFMDVSKVLTVCSSACPFHTRLIRNLMSILAEKNLMLNDKLSHVTQRSIREKLLSYLSMEARRQGSGAVEIPFDRQQLADYLAVDRSAMSKELGKMRDEGLLSFHRSRFELCCPWQNDG